MHLRRLLDDCGAWPEEEGREAVIHRLRPAWSGTRVFMTKNACRRAWRGECRGPFGAAERLANDIEAAILAEGGTDAQVRDVLLGCLSAYLEI